MKDFCILAVCTFKKTERKRGKAFSTALTVGMPVCVLPGSFHTEQREQVSFMLHLAAWNVLKGLFCLFKT